MKPLGPHSDRELRIALNNGVSSLGVIAAIGCLLRRATLNA